MSLNVVKLGAAWRRAAPGRLSIPLALLAAVLGCGPADPPPSTGGSSRPVATAEPRGQTTTVGLLRPGEPARGELAPGETHAYTFELPAGFAAEIEVDSMEIDLVATLFGEEGGEIARLVTQASNFPEPVLATSDAPKTLRIEIRPGDEERQAGRYSLALQEPRAAGATDALRLSAQRRHAEGLALSVAGARETNEQALALFEGALEGWRAAGDAPGTARALHWSALMLKDLKRYEEAEERLLRALELWREIGRPAAAAETLYRLGTLQRLWGRQEPAIEAFAEALPLFQEAGDRRREARTLYNQGLAHRRLGSMQRALDLYERARAIWLELGDQQMEARTVNNIAVVRQLLGESERAIESFHSALAIYEQEGDTVAQQIALNNIGWVHHKALGEPSRAIEFFERALRLAEESDDLNDQAAYLVNLARARIDLGDPQAALADADRARRAAAEGRNQDREIAALVVDGQARHAGGRHALAAARFEEALAAARPLGLRSRESSALYHLARTRRAQGRLEAALAAIRDSLAILESVRTGVDSRSLKSTFLAFRREYYELEVEILVELARRDPRSGAAGEALAASERARARGLLETLAEARADLSRGVDVALLDEALEVRRTINDEDLRRWSADGEERQAAAARLADLFDRLEAVERRVRQQSPQYAALARPRPLGLAEVRSQVLDRDSLLLEYSLGKEAGFLFAVTGSSIEIFDLPPLAVVEEAAREVYERLTDRQGWLGSGWRAHRSEYRSAAARLAEMVLGPVAGILTTGRRLIVAPEGPLHFIPFAALPMPGAADWRPLVVDHEVVHLPSASALGALRRQLRGRQAAPRSLAVLADPVFGADDPRLRHAGAAGQPATPTSRTIGAFGTALRSARETGLVFRRLPHSRREADGIAALVEPRARWVALDFEASRAAALSPELGRYRIVHFATHGFLNSRTPQLSGLTLSLVDADGSQVDGFLRLHDVYNLELGADLVVLSACQTALGRAIRGEGLVGLVRGFLHAGSRGVIASLWQIEDEATARLMERLYSGLLERGLPAGAALRGAQIEMLNGELDPRWRSPYFWGAFVLQGDWR